MMGGLIWISSNNYRSGLALMPLVDQGRSRTRNRGATRQPVDRSGSGLSPCAICFRTPTLAVDSESALAIRLASFEVALFS